MADFSFLSDSDNEKAVEELLSQAMDQSVLEQVAAINCSGFTDSVLPTQLETRFRKLKSLPAAPATSKPSAVARNSRSFGSSEFPGPISDSPSDCSSPPAKTGCFWCSPKKGFSKKGKENKGASMELKWGKDDELLSDLSIFSSKNQEKLMKKAMVEQEKINREAEKIVKWAKQASARMDVSSIEDELSDEDTFK